MHTPFSRAMYEAKSNLKLYGTLIIRMSTTDGIQI